MVSHDILDGVLLLKLPMLALLITSRNIICWIRCMEKQRKKVWLERNCPSKKKQSSKKWCGSINHNNLIYSVPIRCCFYIVSYMFFCFPLFLWLCFFFGCSLLESGFTLSSPARRVAYTPSPRHSSLGPTFKTPSSELQWTSIPGWWLRKIPLWKIWVNWDDDIPNIYWEMGK